MIRMTKQADYGILFLTCMAGEPLREVFTARDLAEEYHLGIPTVSKVLKQLTRGSVLVGHRGIHGGYSLARDAEHISVADIIAALDGPIAITECAGADPSDCRTEPWCPISGHWQRINKAIVGALEGITLAEMVTGVPAELALLDMSGGAPGHVPATRKRPPPIGV